MMPWVFSAVSACVSAPPPEPTDHSATEGHSATGTSEILLWAWEENRACWSQRYVDRPTALWEAWLPIGYTDCWWFPENSRPRSFLYATADGVCVQFRKIGGEPQCQPQDPWIVDCATVPGCCERVSDDYAMNRFCGDESER